MSVAGPARWEARRTSFGASAEAYERARPGWPADTVQWLLGTDDGGPLAGRGPLEVLDVGAGTGKLTRTVRAGGHRVVALDPSPGMLRRLGQALPDAGRVQARAERIPLPTEGVDVVLAAQAWHWVDPTAAGAEVARVLRLGGVFGLCWHVRDENTPWVRELDGFVGRPDSAVGPIGGDLAHHSPVQLSPDFAPMERRTSSHQEELTLDGLVELTASLSYVAMRPDRGDVLARVRELGLRVCDARGRLAVPYRTYCYRAVRV